jgi:hypothetical protein
MTGNGKRGRGAEWLEKGTEWEVKMEGSKREKLGKLESGDGVESGEKG